MTTWFDLNSITPFAPLHLYNACAYTCGVSVNVNTTRVTSECGECWLVGVVRRCVNIYKVDIINTTLGARTKAHIIYDVSTDGPAKREVLMNSLVCFCV